MEIRVSETGEEMAQAAARRVADLVASAEERFSLGLAGGSTPAQTYRSLRGLAPGWEKVDAWLSDERWVPSDHERSNGRMAAEALIDHVGAEFTRPRWSEHLLPEDAAAHYEARLRSIHGGRRPNLVLLGVGEDGHTASLFPGTTALEESSRWFVANHVPQLGEERLTATFPLLWRSRLLMVLAVGGDKAEAVQRSFEGSTPAGRLGEGEAVVEWYLDRSAAALVA
ncbi:MAG TPA: 6-phosphogluconolactonase [Acidimicrobiia bacterium]|nr:6-phosphogluconolactonase [Acidimicrobiia bacterium]